MTTDTHIQQIRKTPVIVDNIHESLFRSSQMLNYVKVLLELGTPTEVILEIIHACYVDDLSPVREMTRKELNTP